MKSLVAAPPPPAPVLTFSSPRQPGSKPARPPPPTGLPAMPGTGGGGRPPNPGRPPGLKTGSSDCRDQVLRAKSMSPPSGILDGFSAAVKIGKSQLQQPRMSRSASIDSAANGSVEGEAGNAASSGLPPGAKNLMDMGFSERKVRAALERSKGNAEQAVDWLLSQPPSPTGGGGGVGGKKSDAGDFLRPPSPSAPPLIIYKPEKKTKTPKSQNPVFDQEAFTPVLIPARRGAVVVASPRNTWSSSKNDGGSIAGVGVVGCGNVVTASVRSPVGAVAPSGFLVGPNPVQSTGARANLLRPRSTPDMISALDPDQIDSFTPAPVPPLPEGPTQQQQVQDQHPSSPPPGDISMATGMLRRQSAPTVLSPGRSPGGPGMMPTREAFPDVQLAPQQLQQQHQAQQQLSPRPMSLGPMDLGLGPRRPPPPSGPAAVGGSTARGPGRTQVPSGRAAIGGNVVRSMLLPTSTTGMAECSSINKNTPSHPSVLLPPTGPGQGQQARPQQQFQQRPGVVQPQQQARPPHGMQPQQQHQPMQGGLGMQGSGPPQQTINVPAGGGITQLPMTNGSMWSGMAVPFGQQQPQQQFSGQSRGSMGSGAGQASRELATNPGGQQMVGQAGMVR